MESVVTQINDEGYPINGAKQRSTWTVSCAGVFISEPKETPVEAGKVTVKEQNGYEVITPSDYQETGTMPVYQAIETNLETAIKPESLFNRLLNNGVIFTIYSRKNIYKKMALTIEKIIIRLLITYIHNLKLKSKLRIH